jgi:hypothetical protein
MFWVPCFDVRYVGCMLFFFVLCCWFLWIVRLWLALWYFLAFICTRQMIKYRNKEATSLNLKLISRIPLIVCIIHYKVKKFWIDQLLCYKFWKVWTDSEHSEHWLKILIRFWTFWTLTEQSLSIVGKDWAFWTVSEQIRNILNIVWKVWTDS